MKAFLPLFVVASVFAAPPAPTIEKLDPALDALVAADAKIEKVGTGYGWADQAKGTVRIPLDRAMELTVAKLAAQGEPRPAYPIDPNVPLGSAVKPGGLAAAQPTPPPFNAPAPAPPPAPADPAATPAAP